MSESGLADRERILRLKRGQLSGIVTSRKRKLREFFAVCDHEGPIPILSYEDPDAPPTNEKEERFLDVCDILQDRLFDESNLPTRRQLRSETAKQRSPIRKVSPDGKAEGSRKSKVRDGSRSRKSRAATPSSKSEADGTDGNAVGTQGLQMQETTSKGSQTGQPAEPAVLDEIVEEPVETEIEPRLEHDDVIPPGESEIERIRTEVTSRPNSPGVDPREAIPISAEDAAQLNEPLVDGLGSHDGHHKAAVAHLPPKEVQEQRLKDAEEARKKKEQLSINLPPRDNGRPLDPMSSPGSTIDAHSATTPALHDASTDTSPDNGSRYDIDRLESKEDEVPTPPELRKTPEEIAEKKQHDQLLQAREDIAREEILKSSPGADEQLREEDEAAEVPDAEVEDAPPDDILTKEATEVVKDVVDDAVSEEEVVGVPTPAEDVLMTDVLSTSQQKEPVTEAERSPNHVATTQPEVADSEADETPPVDDMDIDSAPMIKDSFESSATVAGPGDTTPASPQTIEPPKSAETKTSSATPTNSTPRRTPSTPAAAQPVLERMTTRVSSGAMRHKSVSEILGETPRPDRQKAPTESDSANSRSPSGSATPQSLGTRVRSLAERQKEKERSKLSTVVFAKQTSRPVLNDSALMPSGQPQQDIKEDYFMPLFLAESQRISSRVVPQLGNAPNLDQLLSSARKTITTSNAYVPIDEHQAVKVLRRIHSLQKDGKWSLRQIERSVEPPRPRSHWDVLLHEAKWMRTDFREERKWKMAAARNLAADCAEWVAASPEDRKLLQVKATPPSKDVETNEDPTPDLVSSGEIDSPMEDEEPRLNLQETIPPTGIFLLRDDDVVFGLRRSPTTDKLLEELPMYGAPLEVPPSKPSLQDLDPDRFWKRPALPLSKYVEGRLELKLEGPPRKKSRFQYEQESDDEDEVVFGEPRQKRPILPPEKTDVALFNPEHKHIRDRIHAGHQFRPPSEFPMPVQSFFEFRTASQWTYEEDNQLKTLVREYQYNWSLISNILTSPSLFSSGAERRTPWECFERWIHLEGLPADMGRTHYFRNYNSRIEAANRIVMAQQMPQQVNAQGQVQPARRRTTTSVRVERRRNQKHLTLVDAMRKLAKKRETNQQKQAHAANLAAMRKQAEVPQPRTALKTPQQLSKLKHEHEQRVKEQQALYQQRVQQQQRQAALQARMAAGGNPQQPIQPVPNGQQRPPTVNGAPPNGTPATGQNLTVPGQNQNRRPMPPQMAVPMQNGLRPPQALMNGMPQAPMQLPGQLPMPNPALDVGLISRAHQIQQQQRQQVQNGQMGQMPGQHNSPPRMNGMSPPGFAQMQNGMMPFPPNGNASPSGTPQGQAGSPRMGNETAPQAVRLEQQIRAKFPNASESDVRSMLVQQLQKSSQRQGLVQSAMNAAAGGMNGGMNMGIPPGIQSSPQLYAQMLRQQQEQQQKQAQAHQQAANAQANGNGGQQGHQRSGSGASGK